MDALPWTFAHGAWIWRIGLAVLAVGGGVAGLYVALQAARREAARAVAALGAPRTALGKPADGERVALVGRVAVVGAPCERFEDGVDAAASSLRSSLGDAWSARAERLHLVMGRERVELRGPVHVVVGAHETRPDARFDALPLLVRARIETALGDQGPEPWQRIEVLRSIPTGDEVVVSGVLRREAGEGTAGYRSAAARWVLTAEGRGVAMASSRPPRLDKLSVGSEIVGLAVGVLSGLALFALVFVGGGAWAASSAAGDLAAEERVWMVLMAAATPVNPRSLDLHGFARPLDTGLFATELAAATPFARDRALARYEGALRLRRDPDPAMASRLAGLQRQGGDCAGAATTLAESGLLAEGERLARGCDDRWTAAKIAYVAGRFEEASDLCGELDAYGDPALFQLAAFVHLAAGRANRAAHLFRVRAARGTTDLPEPFHDLAVTATPPADAARSDVFFCLADALDARAGSASSRARLLAMAADASRGCLECAILAEDVVLSREGPEPAWKELFAVSRTVTGAPEGWARELADEAHAAAPRLASAAPDDALPGARDDAARTWSAASLLTDPAAEIGSMLPAVDKAALDALAGASPVDPDRRALRYRITVRRARFEAAAGETEAARALIAAARADLAMLEHAGVRREQAALDALEAAVALDARDLGAARSLLDGGAADPLGALRALVLYEEGTDIDLAALPTGEDRVSYVPDLYALAARGDGALLATWLGRPDATPGLWLRFGATRVRTGNEALARRLRHGTRKLPWRASPRALLAEAVLLRRAAEATGDAETAAAQRAIASHLRGALLRRDVAVPLAILGWM